MMHLLGHMAGLHTSAKRLAYNNHNNNNNILINKLINNSKGVRNREKCSLGLISSHDMFVCDNSKKKKRKRVDEDRNYYIVSFLLYYDVYNLLSIWTKPYIILNQLASSSISYFSCVSIIFMIIIFIIKYIVMYEFLINGLLYSS